MSESQPGGPLSVRLDSLPLSSRTKNLFHWTGFVTIDDLLGSSLEELRRIKGFGKISLEETEAALAQHGIYLRKRKDVRVDRLATHAPKLLAALKALHEYTRANESAYRNGFNDTDPLYCQVTTVIREAEEA